MTPYDRKWEDAIAEISSLRFQLVNNIMPPAEQDELAVKLICKLHALADSYRRPGSLRKAV